MRGRVGGMLLVVLVLGLHRMVYLLLKTSFQSKYFGNMISKVVTEQMGLLVDFKTRFILLLFLQLAPGGDRGQE